MSRAVTDEYYASEEYRVAIDDACKHASHDGNPRDKFPNRPKEDWDALFISRLKDHDLMVKALPSGSCFDGPLMAPVPMTGGYAYPSYIVRTDHV